MITQDKNVPALRFSEFQDEWKEKRISEVAKIMYGKDQKQIAEKDGKYPILGTGGIMGKTNSFLYDKPSVLIGRKGTIDQPRYMETPFWTVDTLFYTELLENTFPKWLYYKFETINWYLHNEASGVPSLSASTIYKIKLNLPTLPEQQKIAAFLTAVDEKIQQLTGKKDLLEQYKKGVMQKIFNQEIRFKDDNGNDFADWEEKNFEEIYVSLPTKQFQVLTSEILESGQFKVIDQGQKKVAGFSNDSSKLLKDVPIIIFGDHTAILKYIDFNFIVGADGTKILKNKFGNLKFFYYCLVFNNIETEGYKRHYSILKSINLQFPESVEEQNKIASFLSVIDDKINLVNQQLEKTKEYKKGLLHQMFI